MSDPRTWTPSRGVPTRATPRDTAQVLQDLGIDSAALAREVRKATPPWLEWVKLVPIYVLLAGGFAAAAVKWDRSVSRDEVAAKVAEVERAAELRMRALELELAKVERDALSERLLLQSLRTEVERRLGQLEDRARKKR